MSNEHDGINLNKDQDRSDESTWIDQSPTAPENHDADSNQPQPTLKPPYASSTPPNPYASGQPEQGQTQYTGSGPEYPNTPNQAQLRQHPAHPYPSNGWNGQPYPSPSQYPGYGQGVPYQGGYMQSLPPSNGFGVTALVLGILAVLGCWIPFFNIFSILLGIGALIFGFMGLRKTHLPKGAAIAGLVTGGFAFLVASFIMLIMIVSLASTPYDYGGSGYDRSNMEYSSSITT